MTYRLVATLFVLLAIGCAPTITRFSVEPHEICPGTEVTTSWNAHGGRATVITAPEVRPKSSQTYVPLTTTLFVLRVDPILGKPKSRESEVTVHASTEGSPAVTNSEIGFNTECKNNELVALADRPESEWDAHLTVGTVEIEESRTITVTHAGRSATLSDQTGKSDAFKGTHLSGTWSIRAPLLSSEQCDSESPPLDLLILTASVSCGE